MENSGSGNSHIRILQSDCSCGCFLQLCSGHHFQVILLGKIVRTRMRQMHCLVTCTLLPVSCFFVPEPQSRFPSPLPPVSVPQFPVPQSILPHPYFLNLVPVPGPTYRSVFTIRWQRRWRRLLELVEHRATLERRRGRRVAHRGRLEGPTRAESWTAP